MNGHLGFAMKTKAGNHFLFDYDLGRQRLRRLSRPARTCPPSSEGNPFWSDTNPEYSRDGTRIAYLHGDSCPGGQKRAGLWVARADGSAPRMLAPLRSPSGLAVTYSFSGVLAFSPHLTADGRRITMLGVVRPETEPAQFVFDASTGAIVNFASPTPFGSGSVDWGMNRKLLVSTARGLLAARPDGTDSSTWFRPGASDPDWSPSARSIVFVRHRAGAPDSIWKIRKRRQTRLKVIHSFTQSPTFSPNGFRIAFAVRDGVRIMRVSGGRSPLVFRTRRPYSIISLDWQPRHRSAATAR
jgi:Tol biopolymer transport system component